MSIYVFSHRETHGKPEWGSREELPAFCGNLAQLALEGRLEPDCHTCYQLYILGSVTRCIDIYSFHKALRSGLGLPDYVSVAKRGAKCSM